MMHSFLCQRAETSCEAKRWVAGKYTIRATICITGHSQVLPCLCKAALSLYLKYLYSYFQWFVMYVIYLYAGAKGGSR